MELNLKVASAAEARVAIETLNRYIEASESQQRLIEAQHLTIDDIGLTTYTANSLRASNITTLAQLMTMTVHGILKLDRMGAKGLADIRAALARHGATI
ncbi:DNA-directed RNA polymerase subunit alpha C-terminal domain-containing protein [Pararobbsia alpina]|uniref:DNA-directed RNA polymerase subunit alpha n=1 Tax=Pararobbsia alpina TaxID=621374 RepID=A0A6S7BHI8_9BURK|nr:DNA-directed RNA polymerase subunit alpha C-terminal domain-containing protein [Pararobbsia alpina]CAB3800578.1 DNA-directed RNA polymerase subunit alpha [Pararobbsia alpina]